MGAVRSYKNGRSQYVEIDGKRLDDCLAISPKTRGKNKKELSLQLGYSIGYLARAIKQNKISERATALIQAIYDIRPSDYLKEQKGPLLFESPTRSSAVPKNVTLQVTVDTAFLEAIIQRAVKEAFEQL